MDYFFWQMIDQLRRIDIDLTFCFFLWLLRSWVSQTGSFFGVFAIKSPKAVLKAHEVTNEALNKSTACFIDTAQISSKVAFQQSVERINNRDKTKSITYLSPLADADFLRNNFFCVSLQLYQCPYPQHLYRGY